MVRVFYISKSNAFLGDEFFSEGIKEFKNDEAGIEFANRYYLKYEVIEVKAKSKKKVVSGE